MKGDYEELVGRMSCYRSCADCGKYPAPNPASVWTHDGSVRWYCHGDDDRSPTCYMRTVARSFGSTP